MTTAFYRTGTVAVTQNSKVVTGTGTNWTTGPTKPLAGDVFIFNNKMYEIDNVVSDTEIRLYRNFEDSTASSKSYAIMRNASLNISARIAAQVAQVVNQKQIMVDEFHDFLTNNTDSTVPLTDTLGNTISVTPIPMLDKDYIEKIGGIDSAVNQAIQDINDAFDNFEYPVLTAAQRQAIVDANEEKFAASGMVHTGKSRKETTVATHHINEGMYTFIAKSDPNILMMGRGTHEAVGKSKTYYPVTHIAGSVSNIIGMNYRNPELYQSASLLLPPAPDGTVIYDSTNDVRGTGKATLDLLTEVDPKYGNIAINRDEAAARAFDGWVKNSDFRDGMNGWSNINNANGAVVDGKLQFSQSSSTPYVGLDTQFPLKANVDYVVEVVTDPVPAGAKVYVELAFSGTESHQRLDVREGETSAKKVFQVSQDTYIQIRFREDGDTGKTVSLDSVSLKPSTEEVVTERVDMFGFEQFDMVMKDGEIFDMVQNQSDTFGASGVPTVTSVRPDSFFAVYEGQKNIVKGKCVRWPNLNRAQKRHIAKYMKERLWKNEDGDLCCSPIRQRSFAGAGNGDWQNVFAASPDDKSSGWLNYSNQCRVSPQAANDVAPPNDVAYPAYQQNSSSSANYPESVGRHKGVFVAAEQNQDYTGAYKGRCFFYVLGTVSRLNQGAYIQGVNDLGTATPTTPYEDSKVCGDMSDVLKVSDIYSVRDCFMSGNSWGADVFVKGRYSDTGELGSPSSTNGVRPDKRLHNAIYADGLGGVVDLRLPAYAGGSPEEAAKVWEKVKDGTYRGLEKLVRTHVVEEVQTSSNPSAAGIVVGEDSGIKTGDTVTVTDGNVVLITAKVLAAYSSTIGWDSDIYGTIARVSGRLYRTIVTSPTNISVSGAFSTQMVIGEPAKIPKINAFKNGWLGTWCRVIPDGTSKDFTLTSKSLVSESGRVHTPDDGVTWYTGVQPVDEITNSFAAVAWNADFVLSLSYTALANPTKESNNKPVLNGEEGVGNVYVSCRGNVNSRGMFLAESTIGKVLKSSVGIRHNVLPLIQLGMDKEGLSTSGAAEVPAHSPVTISAPNNNSIAVKALPYQISDRGQCSLGIHVNEMTWGNPTYLGVFETNTTWAAGEFYRVQDSATGTRKFYRCEVNTSLPINSASFIKQADGSIKYHTTGVKYFTDMGLPQGWGDDGTMKITDSGSDTFVDLNGNTNLSVVHELALPYGWTKNRARASVQVEGVDL